MQAAKLLTLNKTTPQDMETIFDVCFLLNTTQIKKLLSVYYAADFDSPLTGNILTLVSNRAIVNDKEENLALDLGSGPDAIKSSFHAIKTVETYIPSWINLPFLQAILSATV
jgi:myosin-5